MEREACQLHEKCSDLAGKRVSRVGKGRRNQHAVILQHPPDFLQGLSPAAARCAARWTRSPHSKDLSAYGRRNISCTEKCSLAERVSRFASAIISAEASVASMCAAAFTMCFAINPVPLPVPAPSWLSRPAGSAHTSLVRSVAFAVAHIYNGGNRAFIYAKIRYYIAEAERQLVTSKFRI